MWVWLFFVALVILPPAPVAAQGVGVFSRPNCTTLTTPVSGATECLDTTRGVWNNYDGTGWQSDVARATLIINAADPRFGLSASNTGAQNQTAMAAAIAALPAAGGTIYVPPGTYNIAGTGTPLRAIDLSGKSGIRITSLGNPRLTGITSRTQFIYTSATGALVLGNNATSIELDHLSWGYNNAAYNGHLLDFGSACSGTPQYASHIYIHDNQIGGQSTSIMGATSLLHIGCTVNVTVKRNTWSYAAVGIRSVSSGGANFQNGMVIDDLNYFQGHFSTIPILAGGQAWTICGNSFEPINDAQTSVGAVQTTTLGVRGFRYCGNWHNEEGVAASGTYLNASTAPGIVGGHIFGNHFAGVLGTAVGIDLGASNGVEISGNIFNLPTPVVRGTSLQIAYSGNNFPTGPTYATQGVNKTNPYSILDVGVRPTTTPTTLANLAPASLFLTDTVAAGATGGTVGVFGVLDATPGISAGIGFIRGNAADYSTAIVFYTHPATVLNISTVTERWRISPPGGLFSFNATGGDPGIGAINIETLDGYLVNNVALKNLTETLANKTVASPVLSGTVTGTYTLGGTPTLNAALAFGASGSLTAPVLSGTATGTYTLGGAATISSTSAGPHAIGGATNANTLLELRGTAPGTSGNGLNIDISLTPSANSSASMFSTAAVLGATLQIAASGTHPDFAAAYFSPPTIGAGAGTLTNATTVKIVDKPVGGTNARALWVAAGGVSVGASVTDQGTGTVNAATAYYLNGTIGQSVTTTVRAAGGAADCTLIFTGGIKTGGTC